MHRCCSLFLILLLVLAVIPVGAVDAPQIVRMANTQGEVLFHHQEHLAAVNDCVDCHHTGLEAGGCRNCHGLDREVPRIKHAFHRQCRNCHIKNGASKECTTCHNSKRKTAKK